MKKKAKGEYGYIAYEKKIRFIKAFILLVIPVTIFATARMYTGTAANIFSLVSAVGLIPASQAILNFIMIIMQKNGSKEIYDMTEHIAGDMLRSYELVVTAYEGQMPMDAVVVSGTDVACCSLRGKKEKITLFTEHITKILADNGFSKSNVHIFQDEKSFEERLKGLSHREHANKQPKREQEIMKVLKAISL